MKVDITDNSILYSMNKELIFITPCGKNAIRFRSFPSHNVIDESYNLNPQCVDCVIDEYDNHITMMQGTLMLRLDENGRLHFFITARKF